MTEVTPTSGTVSPQQGTKTDSMKILNLQVKNIKKIIAVDITPKGDTVIISGKNGNGKSSTIDSIAMALGGKKLIPSKPVRDGQDNASIQVDLGEFIVTRTWTNPQTSYLSVQTKEGAVFKNPQTMLNDIIGDLSFDPAEFSTMEPSKRLKLLKKITGLDFSDLDAEYEDKYQKRTLTKRDLKGLKSRLDTEFANIEMPKLEGTLEQIESKMENARLENETIKRAQDALEGLRRRWKECKQEIGDLADTQARVKKEFERECDRLEKKAEQAKANMNDFQGQSDKCHKDAERTMIELEPFRSKMQQFRDAALVEAKIRDKTTVEKAFKVVQEQEATFSERLQEINAAKDKMVSGAAMPVDGLGFGDGEVTFNKLPFDQLSSSEQIRISMGMAIALNPKVRIVTIENGSLLDSDAMEQIKKIAKENDFQIWIEKVADTPDGNSIFIEEGKILH